ncbi:Nucleotide-binding universal stress protein, UspA family [Dehalogenimonas formicexedens]|uniref:Nucleotide-binding universal stress protein, UspA family n=1 Tax=Dehalogenimonas formicexedens TaxID=1839801 RepID=A0A1P8F6H9_9CHLR|nr:universal stress protein [Dehalogenimonas formicexedens]APV44035.1 Nucleotide-binding universal stress protein, UspA family [Dehalogenimonas formicexedens]
MYKRVMVPLDGSDVSESIIPQVVSVTKPSNATVVLFQAHAPIEPSIREVMGEDIAVKLDTVTREEAQGYLDKIAGDLANQGIKAEIVLGKGKASDAIIQYATTHAVDLIIMATHGRSGISRWAFGSVAEKVLRQSPVPVLLGPVAGTRA